MQFTYLRAKFDFLRYRIAKWGICGLSQLLIARVWFGKEFVMKVARLLDT